MAQWGAKEFLMPHMVTVDKHGHLWATDVASHTVTKWSPAGQQLMRLGMHLEPGHDEAHFCKPTQARAAGYLSLWKACGKYVGSHAGACPVGLGMTR